MLKYIMNYNIGLLSYIMMQFDRSAIWVYVVFTKIDIFLYHTTQKTFVKKKSKNLGLPLRRALLGHPVQIFVLNFFALI